MDKQEYIEAIKSQVNRYNALLLVAGAVTDPLSDGRCLTLTEDACEFARHLMIDVCEVTNEKEATITRH